MVESDLYIPVKRLFEEMGYSVNAEVKDCDVTASLDKEVLIIELKRSLSVALLAQCVDRQKSGYPVYAAVPKPKKYEPLKFRKTLALLKKLEVGLIFVTIRGEYSFAEIINEPQPFCGTRVNPRKKREIRSEIAGRAVELNSGGITGRKIVTAYMERAVFAACVLSRLGECAVKTIRSITEDENAAVILRNNAYKWFAKQRRGVYSLSEKGASEILLYPELCGYFNEKINAALSAAENGGNENG